MKPADSDGTTAQSDLALASLSFASGCTDVLTFLKLGNVFTSAMTGNTALLAVEIGRGDFVAASRALAALLAFSIGVAIATRVTLISRPQENATRGFLRLLGLELTFLIAWAVLWSASPQPVKGDALYAVIVLSALSMGIQAVAAETLRSGINTIVFTSVLVRIMMSLTTALSRPGNDPHRAQATGSYVGTFAAYACGALLAAVLVWRAFYALIWFPIAAVVLALGISEFARKQEGKA